MPIPAKKPPAKRIAPKSLREISQAKLPAAQIGAFKAAKPSPSAAAPANAPASVPATGKAAQPAASKPPKPAKVAKAEKTVKTDKPDKVVRDGFSMPKSDYRLIGQLKERALDLGMEAKKSEILRAGVKLLTGLDNGALRAALKSLEAVKTGRRKQ